ncbi:hypothetical protein LY625_00840 [Lysobacter sp. GX 14042]|uniref:hypothetical protein n=1 Tax=Lysobacter sp. GX 14042 TaxID=2907155 RepID=UPI001F33DD48|nr:hypothetical protein [Lysobacter sp. GX 14042]MCE7031184.1 hypothetical protein [Lysobacter sp. GX 14042]
MAVNFKRTLKGLRSTRDFRAEILDLATKLVGEAFEGRLCVDDPLISAETVQKEWDAAMEALAPSVRDRMHLLIDKQEPSRRLNIFTVETGVYPVERPNFLFEVLRQLVAASLEDDGMQPVRGLSDRIGASQPTIRAALTELQRAGLCRRWGAHYELAAEDVSAELMARTGALPQTLRFRFAQGTTPRPPAELVERAMLLLGPESPEAWEPYALSGTPVALARAPRVDLMGTPRLDLVAHVPREAKTIAMGEVLRLLDSGLELEPSVLAPAPVVVTLVRAKPRFEQHGVLDQVRCATAADVYLSLLDVDLREQAYQYAEGVRP